jgi:hypothetical protein
MTSARIAIFLGLLLLCCAPSALATEADSLGACCTGGMCFLTSEPQCTAAYGLAWVEECDCESNICPMCPTGVCCLPDGGCQILGECECGDLGGQPHPEMGVTPCVLDPCEMLVAACCVEDGCYLLLELASTALGGQFFPDATSCSSDPCHTDAGEETWGAVKSRYRR